MTKNDSPIILFAVFVSLSLLCCGEVLASKAKEESSPPPVYTLTQLESMLDRIRNPFEVRLPVRPKALLTVPTVPVPPAPPTPPPQPQVPVRPTPSIPVRPPEPPRPPERPVPVPAPAPVATLPDLKLSGIIWNSDRPQAIVNGQVMDVGDIIGGAQIQEINKTGLSVLFQQKTFTINLY